MRSSFAILLAVLLCPLASSSQLAPTALDDLLRQASEQRKVYLETFKNLLSEETKTFEIYDRDGQVKKRRVVRSTFIVYPLTTQPGHATEYRNVIAVDGKDLPKTESRAQDFFERIARVESSTKELEKITDESLRYDEELFITNMTLVQAIALVDNLRPSFRFKQVGREMIDGHAVYMLDYEQTSHSLNISIGVQHRADSGSGINYDVELDGLKDVDERLSGTLWIDTNTYQLVRERRVLSIQPASFETRVPVSETLFEFQNSAFGILTPKRITHLQFDLDKKKRTSTKDVQVVFEYDRFTKPDVDVKASDVKQRP